VDAAADIRVEPTRVAVGVLVPVGDVEFRPTVPGAVDDRVDPAVVGPDGLEVHPDDALHLPVERRADDLVELGAVRT
jgi:hypothetical protein